MSKSIISNEKECFICDTQFNLHKHHIFYGYSNRVNSENEGCWVYLCARHHDFSDDAVHMNICFDITLKKYCQHVWEEKKGSRDEFRKIFGKSYL